MNRIEQLQQFLEKSPNDPFLNHAMALEYVKMNNDEDARKYFEKNLTNDVNYIGTYYHLGKLLERMNATDEAIKIYESGMAVAKSTGDQHAYNELQGAYEDLIY